MSAVSSSDPPAAVLAKLPKLQKPQKPRRAIHATAPLPSVEQTMNGPLYMQASANAVLVRRLKRETDGPLKQLTRWFVENQMGFSFNLITLLLLAHVCFPEARAFTAKFFTLSYYNPATHDYFLGRDDGYLTAFCIVLFTGLRAATMEYLLAPVARRNGISRRKDVNRFCEQGWLLIYTTVLWSLGMYLHVRSPAFFFRFEQLWSHWPSRAMPGLLKGYILAQWAFWLQQIVVINLEERRKDHWQMLTHHLVTIALIYSSYRNGLTPVANLILVLMDIGDLTLAVAKCAKYVGMTRFCDYMFGVFMLSWVLGRHVVFAMVLWSVHTHSRAMPTGCFRGTPQRLQGPLPPPPGHGYLLESLWDADGLFCHDAKMRWGFLSLLLLLEAIILAWFMLIVRVAVKVVRGGGAEDTRSDAEAEEVHLTLEQEVAVEQLDLGGWKRRTGLRRQPSSTGVSIPGHSDRKELLGRIGCEKQVD